LRFDLNLKQLKAFYYVAKHLSFTQAAEDLFISQPAVTMQVSSLERQYGVQLFVRKKNELTLSEAGESLYFYAEKIAQVAFEAEQLLFNVKANPHGILRIGTTRTFARYLLTPYILSFHEKFPHVGIQINEGSSKEMAMSLLYGKNDLAIVARVPYETRLESIPFPEFEFSADRLLLVVPPDHALAQREEIELKDIADYPLILRERGSGTRHVTMDMFREQGFEPNLLLEAGNVDLIKDLIHEGAGVSIMSGIGVDEELADKTLCGIPITGSPAIHIDLVLPKENHRNEAFKSFLSLLLK
jgi:DNA-binding transcriptional LysR family regulator